MIPISNFFICDLCDNNVIDVWLDTCHCRAQGMEHVGKKVIGDHDEPIEVCKDFKPKEER